MIEGFGELATVNDSPTGLSYQPDYLETPLADRYLRFCMQRLPWAEEVVKIFGKTHIAARLSCALGDEGCTYRYQGSQTAPVPMPPLLSDLRYRLEADLGMPFNFILATLYRNGNDSVGWHADDERDLIGDHLIANVSLGGTRRFHVKTRDGVHQLAIDLSHGSLTLLTGSLQQKTKHRLAKTKKAVEPRIVLSFRRVKS